MENKEEYVNIDLEDMAKFIHNQTGIEKETIDVVLVAETQYYKTIGIITETDDEETGL
ncbi:hypothetical protein [Paenibacillus illinoisensis]|uniref:hypothetical protein n=1 Tax=Paenibacillus illinoisensis TaxID=59845 RepID=UPI00301CFC22